MLLTDQDLRPLLETTTSIIEGFDVPCDWDSKDSLIQPSSIDLHVGAIFRPGVKPGRSGSASHPRSQLSLGTGETAIVQTKESINLPADYAAFGFPPSSISSQGLLMTNPGHVDPGYSGTLSFTVINMGREPFNLGPKLPIVTLLVFKLSKSAGKDYMSRRAGTSSSKVTQEKIDLLCADFVDVKRRARKEAALIVVWTSLAATILASIATYGVNVLHDRSMRIEEVNTKLVQLQDSNESLRGDLEQTKVELENEIKLEHRLGDLERQLKSRGTVR
jgi:deoxycytidine triphosphate deaminase